MPEPAPIFPVSRVHLDELTDAVGIMQHAIGRRPDPAHGYCVDDVARALIVDLLHGAELGWPAVAASVDRSMAFLEAAFDRESGRFRNFRDVAGPGSSRSARRTPMRGRFSLSARPSAGAEDPRFAAPRAALFELALPATLRLTSPSAVGRRRRRHGRRRIAGASTGDSRAAAAGRSAWLLTEPRRRDRSADWPWPEAVLTYENGLIARALIVAGDRLGDPVMLERGLRPPRLAGRDADGSRGPLLPDRQRRLVATRGSESAVRSATDGSDRPDPRCRGRLRGDRRRQPPSDDGMGVRLVPGAQRRWRAGRHARDRRRPGRAHAVRREPRTRVPNRR